jgi:hypothetical protein
MMKGWMQESRDTRRVQSTIVILVVAVFTIVYNKYMVKVMCLMGTMTECGSLIDRLNPTNECVYRLPRFLARGLQFGWQNGDQLANWTGFFNVTDDPAVQSSSDSSSRYRTQKMAGRGEPILWGPCSPCLMAELPLGKECLVPVAHSLLPVPINFRDEWK